MAKKSKTELTAKDIIAIIVLIAGFVLLGFGIDSYVTAMMTLIIGYYFGRRQDYLGKKKF